jgi:hypothetical protein
MRTFDASKNKYHPLRTLLLSVFFFLYSFLPAANSQSFYPQTSRVLQGYQTSTNESRKQASLIDTTYYFLDYYLSDSYIYKSSYISQQRQALNYYYSYPADTGYRSRNFDCINSISVTFDSLYADSATIQPWSILVITIDTIYVPIIQYNRSTQNDTLTIQLTTVTNGYPNTGFYLLDTVLIDSAGANNIGSTANDKTLKIIKWPLNNYQLFGSSKFAVNVTYYDHTKMDSCWFVYGYGYFNRTCPYQGADSIFASSTHFSNISNNVKPFSANSFAQWNEYTGLGYWPSTNGDNVFFPCVAADSNSYHPGTDGANYLQNIDIYAGIHIVTNTGIDNIRSALLNVSQNYPNPFSAGTTIKYGLSQASNVTLSICDLTGRELYYENYNNMEPGQHSISLNGIEFTTGVYFYTITSSGSTVTKKMVVY